VRDSCYFIGIIHNISHRPLLLAIIYHAEHPGLKLTGPKRMESILALINFIFNLLIFQQKYV
jgi:hypothetical protein